MIDNGISLSDEDILHRLSQFEDQFVERKTSGDSKDSLKTVVGFANSCPIGYPGLLLIGVRNDCTFEPDLNLDSLQRTFNKELEKAYPPIFVLPRVLTRGCDQFLAVIVPGSSERPHFAGPSYIRSGSEIKVASEEQFRTSIATRTSKAYKIVQSIGKRVAVEMRNTEKFAMVGEVAWSASAKVLDCSQFVVVLQMDGNPPFQKTIPLNRILLSQDDGNDCLKLEVYPLPISSPVG